MTNTDLPAGYRWATADETELYQYSGYPGARWIYLTVDEQGVPYTQGECDMAVPEDTPVFYFDDDEPVVEEDQGSYIYYAGPTYHCN